MSVPIGSKCICSVPISSLLKYKNAVITVLVRVNTFMNDPVQVSLGVYL